LEDCSQSIWEKFKDRPGNVRLEVTIHVTNTGDSEFSSEESGIIYLELVLSIANSICFVYMLLVLRKDFQKNEEIDWPLVVLLAAIGIETMHNYVYLIHLISYAYDGVGFMPLQMMSDIF
jgi:hypothetical protein